MNFPEILRGKGARAPSLLSIAMTANHSNHSTRFANENVRLAPDIDWMAAYELHRQWMQTVVRARVEEPQAVDEVMQEIAVRVFGQNSRPTDPEKIAPWLYRVALRETINYRRRCGRQRSLLQRAAEANQHEEPSDPTDWVFVEELRMSVQTALKQLSAGAREILLLKHTEGWTYRQIAEHLGVTDKTVERRLARARDAMRTMMKKVGYRETST